jgi:hypothetical protein
MISGDRVGYDYQTVGVDHLFFSAGRDYFSLLNLATSLPGMMP